MMNVWAVSQNITGTDYRRDSGGKPGVEGNEARCGKRTGDRLAQNATVITKMKFHFTTMLKYKFHFTTVIAQQNQRRAGVRWPPSL
ncbi:TPA: hypothetical protein L9I75_004143 [Klebsiella pneumoniae]|nr:hypothetical protein [Klebsiella pneumoniae]